MSWSIYAVGTAEEIRSIVHEYEARYWTYLPLGERMAVRYLLMHATETAAEQPGQRWVLEGSGHEDEVQVMHTITLHRQ